MNILVVSLAKNPEFSAVSANIVFAIAEIKVITKNIVAILINNDAYVETASFIQECNLLLLIVSFGSMYETIEIGAIICKNANFNTRSATSTQNVINSKTT